MILTDSVSRGLINGSCMTGHTSSKRRKELATIMGSLLEEMAKAEATKAGVSSENTSVIGKNSKRILIWRWKNSPEIFVSNPRKYFTSY